MARIYVSIFLLVCVLINHAKAQISLTNNAYFQNFDSLASKGTTAATLPYGWYIYERNLGTGKAANRTYAVNDGAASGGNTYSYGVTGQADRALGTISTGTLATSFGAKFINHNKSKINALKINFAVEQWRLGAIGRTDSSRFSYSTNADSLGHATAKWIYVSKLNLVSNLTTGATGKKNGNLPENKTIVSYTLNGLHLAPGDKIWFRWEDANVSKSDDGLAIDSFSIEPVIDIRPAIFFQPKSITVNENEGFVKTNISISSAPKTDISFRVKIMEKSSAKPNIDFEFNDSATYIFPAESDSHISILIKILDDKIHEPAEKLFLQIYDVKGANLADSILEITILDNDILFRNYRISQIRRQNSKTGVADSLGVKCWVKGISQSVNFVNTGLHFVLADASGAVFVHSKTRNFNYSPEPGDSLKILGKVDQINGLTVFIPDSIVTISSLHITDAPKIVSTLSEENEAQLVQLKNVRLLDENEWQTGSDKPGFCVKISDDKNDFTIYISAQTELFDMPAPKGKFNITGFVSQQDSVAPFLQNYIIMPRFEADIEPVIMPKPVYKSYYISDFKSVSTSGEADSIGVKGWINGIVHSESLFSQEQQFSLMDLTAGIIVNAAEHTNYLAKRGDMISVLGTVNQTNGLIYFDADSIIFISANNAQFEPKIVSALSEKLESSLVKIENVKVTEIKGIEYNNQIFRELQVTQGDDLFTVYLNKNFPEFAISAENEMLNITGIVLQNDFSSPFTSNYIIVPRDSADIQIIKTVGFQETKAADAAIRIYPNPAENFINISTGYLANSISVVDITGKEMLSFKPQSIFSQLVICNLKPGIYFLKVALNGEIKTQKFIKK